MDSKDFNRIYDKYFGLLFYTCQKKYHLLDAVSEDLIADTYVELWRNRDSVAGASDDNIKGWMKTVLVRKILDHLKRSDVAKLTYIDDMGLIDDVDEVYIDFVQIILDAFSILSKRERYVMDELMRGATIEDIIIKTGSRPSTIWNQKLSAIAKLRAHFGTKGSRVQWSGFWNKII